MQREIEIQKTVIQKLLQLGYDKDDILEEYRVDGRRRADIVVFQNKNPYLLVEVKRADSGFPSANQEIIFHPNIRQAQSLADKLQAPYYLVTNGNDYFWFQTDNSGRPSLLNEPVSPISFTSHKETKEKKLTSIFSQLNASFQTHHSSVLIYYVIKAEVESLEFKDVKELIDNENPFLLSKYNPALIEETFDRLKLVDFFNVDPETFMQVIDKVFFSSRIQFKIPLWLSYFFADLIKLENNNPGRAIDLTPYTGNVLLALHNKFPGIDLYSVKSNSENEYWIKIQELITKSRITLLEGQKPPIELLKNYHEYFDNVILIPPFGLRLNDYIDLDLFHAGNRYAIGYYLEIALKLLRKKGRIIFLVPEGFLFSSQNSVAREYIRRNSDIHSIISLPPGALWNTGIKSSILIIEKEATPTGNVLMCEISNLPEKQLVKNRRLSEATNLASIFHDWKRGSKIQPLDNYFLIESDKLDYKNLTIDSIKLSEYKERLSRDDVNYIPLENVIKLIKKGSPIKLDDEGDIPLIGPAAIRPFTLRVEEFGLTKEAHISRRGYHTEQGDVLVNSISTHRGNAVVVDHENEGFLISQHVIVIKPDTDLIAPQYLAAIFNSEEFKSQLELISGGAVIKSISVRNLKDLFIPLPSMSEQLQIVSKIEAKRKEVQLKKEELRKIEDEYSDLVNKLGKQK